MSDAIDPRKYAAAVAEATRRKDRIERLEGELADRDKRIKDLESAASKLDGTLSALTAELDGLKSRPADEKDKRIAELERSLKERDLRSLFDKQAAKLVREDALEAAWKLAGLSPDDAGGPDESAIGTGLADLVSANPFLAKPEPAEPSGSRGSDASGRPHANQSQPGPGAVRGSVNMPMQQQASGDPTAAARQKLASMGAITPNGAFRLG